jgi:hypothetical protein
VYSGYFGYLQELVNTLSPLFAIETGEESVAFADAS